MASWSEVDTVTQRSRTPNEQYTVLTEKQIRNIKKDPSPFFHISKKDEPSLDKKPREGGRYYLDRYCNVTSEHNVRGTQPFGYIDNKKERDPPQEYNTCRSGAAVRWGENKAGERTRSHFFGEDVDRYTNIDMYRRPPTNHPGEVNMYCGRPSAGYYAPRDPSRTTWFGAAMPLNRTQIMTSIHPKTVEEYRQIRNAEQQARSLRKDEWPEYSEYTEKYLLEGKPERTLSNLEQKKKHVQMA